MTTQRSITIEANRLACAESDWRNLAAGHQSAITRTRGGGSGRPNLELAKRKKYMLLQEDSSSSESEREDEQEEVLAQPEEGEEKEAETPQQKKTPKPRHTRVIMEVLQMETAFSIFPCPKCYRKQVELKLRTICLATFMSFECKSSECDWFHNQVQQPAPTTIHVSQNDNYERTTDYAINVLYVLGFMTMGDAHTEAGRLLGLLGLPNDTTMETRSFGIIEQRIGPLIRALCDEILLDNMKEEAKLSMLDPDSTQSIVDYNLWERSLTDRTLVLPESSKPKLGGSYDMAWQQKGSGHQYNSQSGHGTLIGKLTRKVIGLSIKCKICNQCNANAKKNNPYDVPIYHRCWKNHDGTSGSMEAAACLELVVDTYKSNNAIVHQLCCDDDSSVRADCQWNNADYMANNRTTVVPKVPKKVGKNKGELQDRPDKGKLPRTVPEPLFVADPNHRRKGLTGELIKLDTSKQDARCTMTRMDSTRIGKNFGYMARTLRNKDADQYVHVAKAVLEHHFDCHDYCGDWCRRKDETPQQRLSKVKFYRSKTKDAKLYVLLSSRIERFVTLDKLIEMAHGMDTNMNEAFNQICTWFAPKNKVFAGSGSLHNRIALAVGINSIGVEAFFVRIFMKLGINMEENVLHYLQVKEKNRQKRLAKVRTKEAKVDKNKKKTAKLALDTRKAKVEFHKREGTYRKGMNLDDPYSQVLGAPSEDGDDAEAVQDDGAKKPKAKRRKTSLGEVCEYCGNKGHLTKRSKSCTAPLDSRKMYRRDGSLLAQPVLPAPAPEDGPAAVAVDPPQPAAEDIVEWNPSSVDDADDMDHIDSLDFTNDLADSDDEDDFHDAIEFGSDNEDDGEDDVFVVGGTI